MGSTDNWWNPFLVHGDGNAGRRASRFGCNRFEEREFYFVVLGERSRYGVRDQGSSGWPKVRLQRFGGERGWCKPEGRSRQAHRYSSVNS